VQACRKQGAGGQLSPRFWKVKRRRRATAACRITTCPPRFLDFATCLKCTIGTSVLGWRYLLPMYIKYISFYEFSWMMLDLIFVISSSVFDFYKIRYAVSAILGPTYLLATLQRPSVVAWWWAGLAHLAHTTTARWRSGSLIFIP
jgi:hypothetical protein